MARGGTMIRRSTFGGIALAALLVSAPARATEFVGSEVGTSVKRSIDIIQDHRQLEQTQHRYERILWYFGYTHRWAPGSTTASASFGPFARPEISRSHVLDLFTTAPAA